MAIFPHAKIGWGSVGVVPVTSRQSLKAPLASRSVSRTRQHCSHIACENASDTSTAPVSPPGLPLLQPEKDLQIQSTEARQPLTEIPAEASVSSLGPSLGTHEVNELSVRRGWPKKAELYVLRTDGMSCSRETVSGSAFLSFQYPSQSQHLLVWKTAPKCVMVLKKLGDELMTEFLTVLKYLGEVEGMTVIVEPHEFLAAQGFQHMPYVRTFCTTEAQGLHKRIDFVACLGGDGVLLHASSLFTSAIPPVISFNLGSLGFLTNHEYECYQSDLRDVIYGCEDITHCAMDEQVTQGVNITLRMRLLCEIFRAGSTEPESEYEVLNEVVVDRGANPFLTKIECWENGRLITKVQADGVMLATPTGSTAYSVAAGGSMVHPNVPAILFTPICPHSLSFRPVILPDSARIVLKIPDNARCPAWVCFDGKKRQELERGDSVRVCMSPHPVPTINKVDQTKDWFSSLERCFNWTDRVEQRPLPGDRNGPQSN